MGKRRKWQARVLSFLLVLIMVLQDGMAIAVHAEEGSAGTVKTVQEDTETAPEKESSKGADTDAGEKDTGTPENKGKEEETETGGTGSKDTGSEDDADPENSVVTMPETGTDVSGNDILPDISGNDPVLREPEDYYPAGEEEDYGELAAYDAYSRTYLTGEAEGEPGKYSYVTVIGPSAACYVDEEGELQETDNTLSAGVMAGYALGSLRYENGSGPMRVSLPEKLSQREGIYIDASGHTLELLPEDGDFTRSMTDDNAIRYSDVFEGIDYQYTVLGDCLKEDIILLEQTERNTFSYQLRTDGLKAELSENQVILYEDDKEEPVYFLEAPEMIDAAGEVSFAVKLILKETEEDTYRVSVEADKE